MERWLLLFPTILKHQQFTQEHSTTPFRLFHEHFWKSMAHVLVRRVAHGYTIFASASSSFNKLFVWDVPPTSASRGQAWGASLTPGPMFYKHHTKFQGSTHQIHSQKLLQVPTTSLLDHNVSAWAGCKWNHQASSERPHGYNVAYVARLIQSVHLCILPRQGRLWRVLNFFELGWHVPADD